MGATGPRSITGAVLVGNAETLSGLVLHQFVSAGAPFVYGIGADAMDMRTMIDPYVSPERCSRSRSAPTWLATTACRASPTPAVRRQGARRAVERRDCPQHGLGSLSRATLLHDVGYLESGLQSSYESIVLGDELVGYARQFMREVPVDDYSLALDEIKAAGPGGNHLATRYTRRHHREFWSASLLDHGVHDRWEAEGSDPARRLCRRDVLLPPPAGRPFGPMTEQDAWLEAPLDEALAHQSPGV